MVGGMEIVVEGFLEVDREVDREDELKEKSEARLAFK